ncbi:MAG: hypothetical protein VYA30_06290 [Myxococcota bacterium]|nr:hypothetical protein [Myxococcota bacterium]
MTIQRKRILGYLVLSLALLPACSDEQIQAPQTNQPNAGASLPGDTGKADGLQFQVADYFKNTIKMNLADLTDRVAVMATDEVNSLLSRVPFADIRVSETALFGLNAGLADGSTIGSIDDIADGLTAQYGDQSLVAQLNETRRRFLTSSNHSLYAESEFSVRADASGAFKTAADDFDVQLGFDPSIDLVAKTVFAHDSNYQAVLTNPLQAARELRGFVLPRDIDDLRNLLPGESVNLTGTGVLGFNIGANLPIFSFNPVDYMVLTARFDLGGRVRTSGLIDIQYIRGDGSNLIIDVGLTNAYDRQHKVSFESGYGLEGIPPLLEVSVGSRTYSLGQIAEQLVERRLSRSGLLSYGISSVTRNSQQRQSIQRFSIDLNQSSRELDQAIKQVAGGDLRLIQSLADRRNSGVKEMVSFERQITEKFKHLGAHLSSMRFFSNSNQRDGKVVVHQNGTVDELLFSELETRSGRFFTDWGFKRMILTNQTWRDGVYEGATSNVRLAVSESDSFTDRDQVLDHVDTALLSVIDFESAYTELTRAFEELQHEVDEHCARCDDRGDFACKRRYERCIDELISDAEVTEWRGRLQSMTNNAIGQLDNQGYSSLYDDRQAMARQLLELKLHLSSVKELPVALADVTGRTSILSDYRVSQQGLNQLFRNTSPDAFRQRLEEMLTMIVSKRSREYDTKFERALGWLDGKRELINDMVNIYIDARKRYIDLDDSSRINVAGRSIGDGAFVITQGAGSEEDGADPTLLSIAEQKAILSANMVEKLVDRGRQLNLVQALIRLVTLGLANPRSFESHHLITYTLVSLIEPEHREWLMSLDFEEPAFADIRLYSRGIAEDGLIEVGTYDLDELTSP